MIDYRIEHEVKITVRLTEDADYRFWSEPVMMESLKSDLGHKFDVPNKNVSVELKEVTNYGEICKFLYQYVKDLEKGNE